MRKSTLKNWKSKIKKVGNWLFPQRPPLTGGRRKRQLAIFRLLFIPLSLTFADLVYCLSGYPVLVMVLFVFWYRYYEVVAGLILSEDPSPCTTAAESTSAPGEGDGSPSA